MTDHKLLVPLIATKPIDEAPIHCKRLLLCLMRFNPYIEHVPGKEQVIADAPLRKSLPLNAVDDLEVSGEVEAHVEVTQASSPASPGCKCQISQETENDIQLQKVRENILNGWPKYSTL